MGHVRRLADTSTKRVAVEAVGDRATVAVHRFVEFALKVLYRAVSCCAVCSLDERAELAFVDMRSSRWNLGYSSY